VSQYSKTSFRICGINETCPFAGRELRRALRMGFVGASLDAIERRGD